MVANKETAELGLIAIKGCENPNRNGDVIFVHGLLGHPITTWHPQEQNNQNCWPYWLGRDIPALGIWSYGYNAQAFQSAKVGNPLGIYAEGIHFLDSLRTRGVVHSSRPLIFITYSLGGILVKNMFRTAYTNEDSVIRQQKAVVFLGTPHTNNALVNLIDNFDIINGISKHVEFWKRPSKVLQELRNQQDRLSELNDWYRKASNRNELNIKTKVYYETEKLNGILIVDRNMADPVINGITPIPAVCKNHKTIAKPMRDNDPVYEGVMAFINDILNSCQLIPPGLSKIPSNIVIMNYQKGLQRLKEALPKDTEAMNDFDIYTQQLRENIRNDQLYGSTEIYRSERSRIVDNLNRLSQQFLNKSFNDLCTM